LNEAAQAPARGTKFDRIKNCMNDLRKSLTGLMVTGLVIVLPAFVAGLALVKMFRSFQHVVHPVLDALPGTVFQHPTVRGLAVALVIIVLLLLVGLLARTRAGRVLGRWLETRALSHLPFYTLLRNLAAGMSGKDDDNAAKPVLVLVNPGLQQMGLLIERHADGNATVFLPSSPNPGSGTILIVEAGLLRELNVPAHKVLTCQSHWGEGAAALLATARTVKAATPPAASGAPSA